VNSAVGLVLHNLYNIYFNSTVPASKMKKKKIKIRGTCISRKMGRNTFSGGMHNKILCLICSSVRFKRKQSASHLQNYALNIYLMFLGDLQRQQDILTVTAKIKHYLKQVFFL
jgi:hypothetical protein